MTEENPDLAIGKALAAFHGFVWHPSKNKDLQKIALDGLKAWNNRHMQRKEGDIYENVPWTDAYAKGE